MTDLVPEYTFEGDEIFAIHEGHVIASGTDMEAVESDAIDYLDSLKTTRADAAKEAAKVSATHIITPNGVKAQILSRTASIYGEEISVRLANGQFATYQTHPEDKYVTENLKTAGADDPVSKLASTLDAGFEHDKDSLRARHAELGKVAQEAYRLITAGAPYSVQVELDSIRTAAEVEARQVKEAIDHLEDADMESFIPSAPFEPQVALQADMGRSDSWLDTVSQDMIAESEAVDHEKLMTEGPAVLVSDLETPALADAGVTREMAFSHVMAKTAGFEGEEVEKYREQFVARVEQARRAELAERKTATAKEAAVVKEAEVDAPDDALFM